MAMNMKDIAEQERGRTHVRLAIVALGIMLLAFVDVIVLEQIYKPISTKHGIPWNEFQIQLPLFGRNAGMLWWHVAFIPLGLTLFALVGASARDWRLALAGMVLFATGWEDIAYYVIQLKLVPNQLPWLDMNPLITWTRILTGNVHVTRAGLLIAAGLGGGLAGLILLLHRRP